MTDETARDHTLWIREENRKELIELIIKEINLIDDHNEAERVLYLLKNRKLVFNFFHLIKKTNIF